MKIGKMFRLLYLKLVEMRSTVKYAEKIGVNHGENFHVYGHVKWGSEP